MCERASTEQKYTGETTWPLKTNLWKHREVSFAPNKIILPNTWNLEASGSFLIGSGKKIKKIIVRTHY